MAPDDWLKVTPRKFSALPPATIACDELRPDSPSPPRATFPLPPPALASPPIAVDLALPLSPLDVPVTLPDLLLAQPSASLLLSLASPPRPAFAVGSPPVALPPPPLPPSPVALPPLAQASPPSPAHASVDAEALPLFDCSASLDPLTVPLPFPPSALELALASPPVVLMVPLAFASPPALPVMMYEVASPCALASDSCDSLNVTFATGPYADAAPPVVELVALADTS